MDGSRYLQYFKKPQKLNRRQARWLTELQDYHFTLHHILGKQNSKADLLLRRADHDQGLNDNEDITLLAPTHFRNLRLACINLEVIPRSERKRMTEALRKSGRETIGRNSQTSYGNTKDVCTCPTTPRYE